MKKILLIIAIGIASSYCNAQNVIAHDQSVNTANNGVALSSITMGKDGDNHSGWIQSYGASGADPLQLNPLGGNVGIGTTSPAVKLDVTGGDMRLYNPVSGSTTLVVGGTETGKTYIRLSTSADVSGYGIIQSILASGSTFGNTVINPSGGNVGIGTTTPDDFNTVMPEPKTAFIMAIVDENVTGYAGSRIRLRLLEDITAGKTLIKKGTYFYALINGFTGQRVTLQIKSILYNDKELPVKLDVYDMDGLPGLYVPDSQFRDFTKDLGTNTIQGVSIDGNAQNGSQLLMSSADKIFQSTSTAIASAIRKNKAKIKYNSYIYLIDTKAQQAAQNQ